MSGIVGPGGGFRVPTHDVGAPADAGTTPAGTGAGTAATTIRFGARGDGVRDLQGALSRAGFLRGPADGIFGRGTERALIAFQRANGLTPDGIAGPRTLAALAAGGNGGPGGARPSGGRGDVMLSISGAGTAAPAGPSLETMREAATALVDKHAQHYGVDDPWVNIDSNHALPANVRLGGLKGKWKCNLFAGNTMAAAGFEPPYYGNRGRGEYPNANQLYKWTDKYAASFGNRGHEKFELRGELDVQALSGTEREDAIKALLAQAEPGDMIIVDHVGTDVADGGHCRVVTENSFAADGTVKCAQASFDSALIRDETVSSFTGEEKIWILRPNKPRAKGAASV